MIVVRLRPETSNVKKSSDFGIKKFSRGSYVKIQKKLTYGLAREPVADKFRFFFEELKGGSVSPFRIIYEMETRGERILFIGLLLDLQKNLRMVNFI